MKKALQWLKEEAKIVLASLKRAEAWVKSVVFAAIGGGCAAVLAMYQSGKQFEMSTAHLLEVKTQFIGGALVALVTLWAKSPKSR